MLAQLVAARSPWAPVHVSSREFHSVCTRSAAAHAARRHGSGGTTAAAGGSGGGRPAKTTGRRRGKALLQDVRLKPGEQGDELLEQITRDLKNGIEVGTALQPVASAHCCMLPRSSTGARACNYRLPRWCSSVQARHAWLPVSQSVPTAAAAHSRA